MLYTDKIREDMLAKYRWAEASAKQVTVNIGRNPELAEQSFWAFLTACQIIRFYQASWHKLNLSPKSAANKWIDAWKARLPQRKREAWDVILSMRNLDTHTVPVNPQEEVINSATFSGYEHLNGGHPLTIESVKYVVLYEEKRYVLHTILDEGLFVFKKFIDDFSLLKA